jgi:transcriptional regulator with XRE-family HTH domain
MTPAEFRAARKALGWTQEQAAAALGYAGHRAISALEQGERQVSATLALLVRAYQDGWRPERAKEGRRE